MMACARLLSALVDGAGGEQVGVWAASDDQLLRQGASKLLFPVP
jgi:hypothetical protein